MARLLAYTSPARGHLYPLVPILLELRRRGHAVALRTLADEVPRMAGLGLDAAPIDPRIEAISHDDWQASGVRASLARSTAVFVRRAEHEHGDLRAAIDTTRPDGLIVDINCWGAMAAAERWGGPWSMVCPYPLPLSSVDAPPFGPGFPPARGPLGRLRDGIARPLILGLLGRTMLPGINRLRESLGVPAVRSTDELFSRAPQILYLTAEPFEYARRDWPSGLVMVGPTWWEPPADEPAWLRHAERPIVLVTTSSEFQDDGRLVSTAFDALRDEPVTVVATLPSGDPATIAVPANGRLERFVPHSMLLARAACAVTHGGMGATQKALAARVPVVAVPFGRDQHEVARRVEVAGAGVRLPAARLSGERLRDAVRHATAMQPRARAIADAFAAAGGAAQAAYSVERLIGGDSVSEARSAGVSMSGLEPATSR